MSAVVRIAGFAWYLEAWVATPGASWLGIGVYLLLCALLYRKAVSAAPQADFD